MGWKIEDRGPGWHALTNGKGVVTTSRDPCSLVQKLESQPSGRVGCAHQHYALWWAQPTYIFWAKFHPCSTPFLKTQGVPHVRGSVAWSQEPCPTRRRVPRPPKASRGTGWATGLLFRHWALQPRTGRDSKAQRRAKRSPGYSASTVQSPIGARFLDPARSSINFDFMPRFDVQQTTVASRFANRNLAPMGLCDW